MTGTLDVITAWYQGLPKRARESMSLANLHDLSKSITALQSRATESLSVPQDEPDPLPTPDTTAAGLVEGEGS